MVFATWLCRGVVDHCTRAPANDLPSITDARLRTPGPLKPIPMPSHPRALTDLAIGRKRCLRNPVPASGTEDSEPGITSRSAPSSVRCSSPGILALLERTVSLRQRNRCLHRSCPRALSSSCSRQGGARLGFIQSRFSTCPLTTGGDVLRVLITNDDGIDAPALPPGEPPLLARLRLAIAAPLKGIRCGASIAMSPRCRSSRSPISRRAEGIPASPSTASLPSRVGAAQCTVGERPELRLHGTEFRSESRSS